MSGLAVDLSGQAAVVTGGGAGIGVPRPRWPWHGPEQTRSGARHRRRTGAMHGAARGGARPPRARRRREGPRSRRGSASIETACRSARRHATLIARRPAPAHVGPADRTQPAQRPGGDDDAAVSADVRPRSDLQRDQHRSRPRRARLCGVRRLQRGDGELEPQPLPGVRRGRSAREHHRPNHTATSAPIPAPSTRMVCCRAGANRSAGTAGVAGPRRPNRPMRLGAAFLASTSPGGRSPSTRGGRPAAAGAATRRGRGLAARGGLTFSR